MTTQVLQHKRTTNAATAWPNLKPGQLALNGPQLKIAMGDPTDGTPVELLAIRFFSTTSTYITNDFVVNAGVLLRAIHNVAAGAFNMADWAGAADGLPEAPIDGTPYFRQSAAWVSATLANLGGVAEAPNDGDAYGRKSQSWVQLNALDVVYGSDNVSNALDNKLEFSDLTSNNVSNNSGVAGTNVSNALNTLNGALALKAPLANPTFTGTVSVPNVTAGSSNGQAANTAYVDTGLALKAPLANPTFTGIPRAPTATQSDNSTQLATTAYVDTGLALKAPLANPALTGVPTAPTASARTNSTQISTTAYADAILPAGAVMSFAMSTAPSGWLECNGSAVARTGANAALFAAISTTYGAGDGSTTFNLPDMRGVFARGWDHGRGVDTGRTFGAQQAHGFQTHIHSATSSSSSGTSIAAVGDHQHTFSYTAGILAGGSGGNSATGANAALTSAAGGHTHTATTTTTTTTTIGAPTTGAPGTETRPVNVALLYCIKL